MRSIRKISAVSATLAACALLPAQAIAAASVWDHNGSTMRLEEQGKKRKFVYDQPSRNLATAGVKSGTVLFDGEEKTDGRLAGYAKLFRKGCDPVDYFVEGALDKSKGEILLQGQAPVYSGEGCKITGYSEDGSASSLTFIYQGGGANIARGDDLGPDPRGERDAYRTDPTSRTAPLDRYGRDRTYDSPTDRRAYDDPRYAPEDVGPGSAPSDTQDPRYGSRDSQNPRYGSRYGQDPLYPPEDVGPRSPRDSADPRYEPRDYADRGERYPNDRRYDGNNYGPRHPSDAEPDDSDFEDDDNEPAYIPYQPFWRRWRGY
jgi:hypothetical protein